MTKQDANKFVWVIKDFTSLKCIKHSDTVLIGDCKWRVSVCPQLTSVINELSLFMEVVDFKSLPSGWRRFARFRITVVRQVSEEPSVTKEGQRWFNEKHSWWGYHSTIPLAKLYDEKEGFLVHGQIMIAAEVDVFQVIGTSEESEETNPLKKLNVESGSSVSERNQDNAIKFHVMNKDMKKAGMDFLLSLTQLLCLSPQDLSIDDIVEAENAVGYMKISGVNVDWLEKKLKEIKEKNKRKEVGEVAESEKPVKKAAKGKLKEKTTEVVEVAESSKQVKKVKAKTAEVVKVAESPKTMKKAKAKTAEIVKVAESPKPVKKAAKENVKAKATEVVKVAENPKPVKKAGKGNVKAKATEVVKVAESPKPVKKAAKGKLNAKSKEVSKLAKAKVTKEESGGGSKPKRKSVVRK